MELWVRSQDKYKLIKTEDVLAEFDYIRVDDDGDTTEIWHIETDKGITIGKYETKERVLKILDEIQSLLEQVNDPNLTLLPVFIYEMPEE